MDTTQDKPIGNKEPVSKGKKKREKRGHSGSFLIRLMIFIIVIVLVLLIAVSREIRQTNKIVSVINELETDQSQLVLQLQAVRQQLTEQVNQTSTNQRTIGEIQKLVTHDVSRWRCQKAEYLIRMADLALRLQRDIPLGIALLKAADSQLKPQPNHKFLLVRRLLRYDIARLSKIGHVDVEEIYLQLQKLDHQVAKLSLTSAAIESQDEKQQASSSKSSDEDRSIWMRGLAASWGAISKVLVIHHGDEAVEPLISPKQRKFLDLNLHVLFAQAQWALLRHQSKIYMMTLNQIETLIHHYFAQGDKATQKMLANLEKIKKEAKLTFQLPKVDHTLKVLKSMRCGSVSAK